ncbi:FkbM family methyltransferase [Aestuariivivens sediminicola]|uniref:FkbM family methyltransferase n=1 Tax=Aestuariivivens sediminicola TaxID=2913560 RepID=UPI001F5704A4|nr:FkbM family methyltransferase [Aestuariivivens sediminicola]
MKKISKYLKGIPYLYNLLRFFYKKIYPDKNNVSYWIKKYIPNRDIQVLQIGSNDGVSGDPLNKLIKKNYKWNVLFVEPIPSLFEKLKVNYGLDKRYKFENAGINKDGKPQKFYRIGDEAFDKIINLSEDYKQIGSFSREQVKKLSSEEVKNYIEELDVTCMNLDELLNKHKIKTLDLVQIDAEGYDWKILSQLNLEIFKPEMIIFEVLNLLEIEKKQALNFLKNSYYIFHMRIDYICVRKDKFKKRDLSALAHRQINLSTD